MIGIDAIVYTVVYLLIAGLILSLLYFLIQYCESQGFGPLVVFKVIRLVFVILVVLLAISLLLNLIGYPIVRWR